MFRWFLLVCAASLSLLLLMAACNPPLVVPPGSLSAAEKQRQWERRRLYPADTLDEASEVVGYTVVVPSFIPDGFSRGFEISIRPCGTGRPKVQPKFTGTRIGQSWGWDKNRSIYFGFDQSKCNFKISGGLFVEIGGKPGERILWPAEHDSPARLHLNWSDGTMFYILNGTLGGPLDEAVIMKIASSVSSR